MSKKKKQENTEYQLIGDKTAKLLSMVDNIVAPTDQSVKLYDLSDIESFREYEDAYNLLVVFLSKKQRRFAWIATMFNAIFTQRVDNFMFSRRILEKLLKQDNHHEFNVCHNDHYQPFIADMINTSKILEVVDEPKGMSAGFYRLNKQNPAYNILCQLISKDYLDASFESRYKWYVDNKGKSSTLESKVDFLRIDNETKKAMRIEAKKMKGEL